MRVIKYTARFKRDYKREKRGSYRVSLESELLRIVELLATDTKLPNRMYNHTLTGNWKNYIACLSSQILSNTEEKI